MSLSKKSDAGSVFDPTRRFPPASVRDLARLDRVVQAV